MSSEDFKKQHVGTQGKYSDPDLMKIQDKKHKVKEKNEKKVHKRNPNKSRKSNSFLSDDSSVKYEENSKFSFSELEEHMKPIEISSPGKHPISITERGESLIYYKPDFFDEDEAWNLFHRLKNATAWNTKNIVIRGEEYPQPRLLAWYGPYPYSYSGTALEAAEMPETVISIKQKIEAYLKDQGVKAEFNSVLLNLYRDEKDSVAWHSDDELTMEICPTIASISLGEVRRFEIRPKRRYDEEHQLESPQLFMNLCHGSLVVMDGCMQEDWQHRIPKEYHDKGMRINLTFRTVFLIDKSPEQYAAASNTTKNVSPKRGMSDVDELYNKLSDREKRAVDKALKGMSDGDKCKAIGMLIELAHDPQGPRVRSPSPRPDKPQSKQSNEIFRKEPNENSEPHFRQGDNNRNNTVSKNQNHAGRGSTRNLNYDDRTNKQLDKEGEERQDKERRYRRDENEERRHRRAKDDERRYKRDENDKGHSNTSLNLAANEFVPKFHRPAHNYDQMSLEELLLQDIKQMNDNNLQKYARNLKSRVLEIFDEFEPNEKKDLEFLCAVTDGSHNTKNQQLISVKMANIAVDYVDRKSASKDS